MESSDASNYSAFFTRWVADQTVNTDLEARQGSYLNQTGLHNLYQSILNDDLTPEEVDAMISMIKPEEPGKINVDDFIRIMKRARNHEAGLKWKKIEAIAGMDQMASALPSSMAQASPADEDIPPSFYNAYSDEENDMPEPDASAENPRSFYESLGDDTFDNPNKFPMGGKKKYKKRRTYKKQRKTSRKQKKSKRRRSSRRK